MTVVNNSDPNLAKSVCEECLRQTKIGYKRDGAFFRRDLKGINYLEVGRSAIISSPITIFIEWCYYQFRRIRDAWKRLMAKLFPRIEVCWGKRMDSALVGRITFAQKADETVPIHHLPVAFWSRTWWGQWRKLSEGITDWNGEFRLPFDLSFARRMSVRKLVFEIHQPTHVFVEGGTNKLVYRIFKTIPVVKSDLIGMEYNLRNIQLFYWEYRTDTALPRAVVKDHDKDAPEYYSQGRVDAVRQQFIPIELTKVKHLEQIKKDPDKISLAQIQAEYPESLTMCIERSLPGYTRGDHWFGERMMNGMNRGYFMPDANEPGYYWMKYFGVGHYESNDEYCFPDVSMKFFLKPDGLPTPVEIRLVGPLNAYNRDPWQTRVFTPEDGDNWQHAKRIARVNGGLCTEVDEHFAGTHTNTEQYAVAAYRNLRMSPMATLLFPHLKEVTLINHSADKILLQDYIPKASALTNNGLLARCKDTMGMLDWKSWECPKPLSDAHTSAKAENLFWKLTEDYVRWFITNNLDEIKKYWFEVYCFSEDLVNHSVPVFLSDVDWSKLSEQEQQRFKQMKEYLSGQFSFDFSLPRENRNGVLRAVSPITLSKTFPEYDADNAINNLVKASTYMIFVATYLHTWANEHQYQDIGEVLYNCLGLRFGNKESGVLAPESDLSIAPDLTRSTQMMWFSNLLSRTEYGFITKDEEKDINPYYSNLLLAHKDEFLSYGVNVEEIESRTNI